MGPWIARSDGRDVLKRGERTGSGTGWRAGEEWGKGWDLKGREATWGRKTRRRGTPGS